MQNLDTYHLIQQIIITDHLNINKTAYLYNPSYKANQTIKQDAIDASIKTNSTVIFIENYNIINLISNNEQYAFEDPFAVLPTITTIKLQNASYKIDSNLSLNNSTKLIKENNLIEFRFIIIDYLKTNENLNLNNAKQYKVNTSLFLNENDVIICDIIANLKKINIIFIKCEQGFITHNAEINQQNEKTSYLKITNLNDALQNLNDALQNNNIITLHIQLQEKFQLETIFTIKYVIANTLHFYKKTAQYI